MELVGIGLDIWLREGFAFIFFKIWRAAWPMALLLEAAWIRLG